VEIVAATHCLDACAVIAYLRNEPGAEILKDSVEQPQTFLAMHVCNIGEAYYDFFRDDGIETAQTAWTKTLEMPLILRRDADDAFIQQAGVIKVEECVSFADAFTLALTARLNVPLVMTDHHECDPIKAKGHFRFLWLR
jgi:uncharacterized protein with PIN domain